MGEGEFKLKKVLLCIGILIAGILLFTFFTNSKTVRHNYLFRGESDHWQGEYKLQGTDKWKELDKRTMLSSASNYELKLIYKGDLSGLSSVEEISIAYQAPHGGGSQTMEFDEPLTMKVFEMNGTSGNSATINFDESVEIIVKWDTFEESFELKEMGK